MRSSHGMWVAVVGQHRVGVGLMSLMGVWRKVGRLALGTIQSLLEVQHVQHGLHLSLGELSEILHTLAQRGGAEYAALREEIRQSAFAHGDETGWREDGFNGYLWSFSTLSVRYSLYKKSRSGEVVKEALGDREKDAAAFGGVLLSDFLSAYSWYPGEHPRCWSHLLGDLHDLAEKHQNPRPRAHLNLSLNSSLLHPELLRTTQRLDFSCSIWYFIHAVGG